MWQASVSRRTHGRVIPVEEWSPSFLRENLALLRIHLAGVGDQARERAFLMPVTVNIQRAVTADELAGLPAAWCALTPHDSFGVAIAVLYSRGLSEAASVQPCEAPRLVRVRIADDGRTALLPEGCGRCASCRARSTLV